MKLLIKSIGLGLCCSMFAHLISFASSEGLANEVFKAERYVSNFTYVSVEGVFIAIAILMIVGFAGISPKIKGYSIALFSLIFFALIIPIFSLRIDNEYLLIGNIIFHMVLFPVSWYVYFINKTPNQASGATS